MTRYRVEVLVGVFVLIGLLCLGWLTVRLGQMRLFGGDSYAVTASFTNVSGLRQGAQVEMAGVVVGKVEAIRLDYENKLAEVSFRVDNQLTLHDDAIVSVKTSGLIGDKYLKITPGGVGEVVEPGGMLIETESAIDIEELVGKYVFGGVEE
jgi:phospholipid/cholesterol/gamma-HCH transport system substrate-binding protein